MTVSQTQLARLAENLSPRKWQIIRAVEQFRLVSAGQLRRRFYGAEPDTAAARFARRDFASLHDLGVLHRLERRVGGVRAGSTGFVDALGPVGRRLLDLAEGEGAGGGRSRYEPSDGFVDHALAVTEIWVSLYEHLSDRWTGERRSSFEFFVERAAWRQFIGPHGAARILKPDAELHLVRGDVEDRWWIEVDRATERPSVIQRKLAAYVSYYRSGLEDRNGVFPLTAWLTIHEPRAQVLAELVAALPPGEQRLFRVGLLSSSSPFLLSHGRNDK